MFPCAYGRHTDKEACDGPSLNSDEQGLESELFKGEKASEGAVEDKKSALIPHPAHISYLHIYI